MMMIMMVKEIGKWKTKEEILENLFRIAQWNAGQIFINYLIFRHEIIQLAHFYSISMEIKIMEIHFLRDQFYTIQLNSARDLSIIITEG